MILYPAIDLINGQCVRLEQGRFDAVTQYDLDPFGRLKAFVEDGAQWVHIVDLDGARLGQPQQQALIGQLSQTEGVKIQSGGGIRTREHVEILLNSGVSSVVVGSAAVQAPEMVREWLTDFGADRLTLALDVRPLDTKDAFEVCVHGWAKGSGRSLWDVLNDYPKGLLKRLLVTDVSRDGMLLGTNLDLMRALADRRGDLELQASGGVGSLEDLRGLKALGIGACIIGKALYEGRFSLREALDVS